MLFSVALRMNLWSLEKRIKYNRYRLSSIILSPRRALNHYQVSTSLDVVAQRGKLIQPLEITANGHILPLHMYMINKGIIYVRILPLE